MKTPKQANIFMIFFLIYSFGLELILPVIVAIFMIATGRQGVQPADVTTALIIGQDLLLFMLPMLIYLLFTGSRLRDIIPIKRLSFSNIVYTVLITLFSMPMMMAISAITSLFTDNSVSESFREIMDEVPWWASIIGVGVMPAIFEESMFRGFILTGYKRQGFMKAALVSALFFGIMHLEPYQLVYATFAGIIFAALVYCTGSIFSSMLAHFIINASQTVMYLLASGIYDAMGMSEELEAATNVVTLENQIGVMFIYVVWMLINLPLLLLTLRSFIRNNKANILEYRLEEVADKGLQYYTEPEKERAVDRYFVIVCLLYGAYIGLRSLIS